MIKENMDAGKTYLNLTNYQYLPDTNKKIELRTYTS